METMELPALEPSSERISEQNRQENEHTNKRSFDKSQSVQLALLEEDAKTLSNPIKRKPERIVQSYTFKPGYDKDLECGVCNDPLIKPIVCMHCQNMTCYNCLSKCQPSFQNTQERKCPICNLFCSLKSRAPKLIERQIEQVKIICDICGLSDDGLTRTTIEEHWKTKCLRNCRWNCGRKISGSIEQTSHEQTQCPNAVLECPGKTTMHHGFNCQWKGLLTDRANHVANCPEAELKQLESRIDELVATIKQRKKQQLPVKNMGVPEALSVRQSPVHARRKTQRIIASNFGIPEPPPLLLERVDSQDTTPDFTVVEVEPPPEARPRSRSRSPQCPILPHEDPDGDHQSRRGLQDPWFVFLDNRVDALDRVGAWYQGQIIGNSQSDSVKVRFDGWQPQNDEWIDAAQYSTRLAPLGTHTVGPRIEQDLYMRTNHRCPCGEQHNR